LTPLGWRRPRYFVTVVFVPEGSVPGIGATEAASSVAAGKRTGGMIPANCAWQHPWLRVQRLIRAILEVR